MNQQLSTIQEIKIKLPKNAKLFGNRKTGLMHLVHYDHVILTMEPFVNIMCHGYKIVSAYGASPTSEVAIQTVVNHYKIFDRFYCMKEIYDSLGKTNSDRKNDRLDYKASTTGIHWKKPMVKAEWNDRISALEKYDYKKGNYLWQ